MPEKPTYEALEMRAKTLEQTVVTLREMERRYRSLYENAQAGLARTRTSDGSILECNTQMARIFGYDDPETFIREYAMADNYVDTAQREKFISELKTAGEIINREVQLYKRDKTTAWHWPWWGALSARTRGLSKWTARPAGAAPFMCFSPAIPVRQSILDTAT